VEPSRAGVKIDAESLGRAVLRELGQYLSGAGDGNRTQTDGPSKPRKRGNWRITDHCARLTCEFSRHEGQRRITRDNYSVCLLFSAVGPKQHLSISVSGRREQSARRFMQARRFSPFIRRCACRAEPIAQALVLSPPPHRAVIQQANGRLSRSASAYPA
jgi:hypothetical protein